MIDARPAFAPADRDTSQPLPSVLADIRTGARALRGAPTAVRLIAATTLTGGFDGAGPRRTRGASRRGVFLRR